MARVPLQRACEGGGEMKMHGPNLGFVILGGCRSLDCCRCCAPPAGARGRSPCHVVKRREVLGRVHGSGPVGAGGGCCAADTTPSAAMDSQASTSHPACASPALLHPPMASQMGDLGGYTGACGSRVRDAAHGERWAGLWPRQGAEQPQEKREAGLPACPAAPTLSKPRAVLPASLVCAVS